MRMARERTVLRRTPLCFVLRYIVGMALKPFSYLMIGVFASGLVMTVLGAVGVLAGS
jgi:hypothetical protein